MGLDDVTRDDHTITYAELLNIQKLQIDCFGFKGRADGSRKLLESDVVAGQVVESRTERDTVTMLYVTRRIIVPAG